MTKVTALDRSDYENGVCQLFLHSREGGKLVTELNEENAELLREQLDDILD